MTGSPSSPASPPAGAARAPGSDVPLMALVAVLIAGFLYVPQLIAGAPIERVMGPVQKIFYFHVPCAWLLMMSVFVCAGGSLAFLFKNSERGDRVALCSAELAVLFGLCVLISGPLWARVAWGVFWQWDARLTSSLLLWLIMVAYLLARRYGGPAARKLAAALALFAAADVPLVYVSVRIWRTIHPDTSVVSTLAPGMRAPFFFSLGLFSLLWITLFSLRLRLETARAELSAISLAIDDELDLREARS